MNASHVRSRLRLSLALAAIAILSACAGPVAPDLIITNARVFTADATRPWAEAIAVRRDRVIGVGSSAEMAASAGPATRVIDAGGRLVVPGFNDAHMRLPRTTSADDIRAVARRALAVGVTSVQQVASTGMADSVAALREAATVIRWRVIRAPLDGDGVADEEPFLPPQPGMRLEANGVAWTLDPTGPFERRALPPERLATVVGWAYGATDPILAITTGASVDGYLARIESSGVAAVWRRKRPRLELGGSVPSSVTARLAALGVVVVGLPGYDAAATSRALRTLADAGVPIAVGSGGEPQPLTVIGQVIAGDGAGLTREAAVTAATRGAAFAEFHERDKGWLGVGALADVAVLSADLFTVPADRLRSVTSVLTVVGGAIVYDPGVLSRPQPHVP